MGYRLVVLPQAEADIAEVFLYLNLRSPEAAERWYRTVKLEIGTLTEWPSRCPLARESEQLGFELRQLLHGKKPSVYRIIFRVVEENKAVHVLAVRHGARLQMTDEELTSFLEL